MIVSLAISLFIAFVGVNAEAEIQRLEVVGVVAIKADSERSFRQMALQNALEEAVTRVAADLLGRSAYDPDGVATDLQLMGSPRQYTLRYRILEDRGERRPLLIPDPDATAEYVVLAEVHVDTELVRKHLEDSGVLSPKQLIPIRDFMVALLETRSYSTYLNFLELLREEVGVSYALPFSMNASRILIRVKTRGELQAFLGKIESSLLERGSVYEIGRLGERSLEIRLF